MSRLMRLVNSRLNVTPNALNVDQNVACSRRARSLTLMTGTSTAYPPLTGVIVPPLAEFAPAQHRGSDRVVIHAGIRRDFARNPFEYCSGIRRNLNAGESAIRHHRVQRLRFTRRLHRVIGDLHAAGEIRIRSGFFGPSGHRQHTLTPAVHAKS